MKILVGYDGSNSGKEALNEAISHAQAFNARLYIIRSLKGGSEDHFEKIENAERDLAYAESFCQKNEIPCETHLLIRGLGPGEDIVKFADENNIDKIVIGVRRRSHVGKIIFGSNARYIIMEAQCPVITVK
ncbi:Universal stress protein family protein [Desulfonema limicola]|uniref:Universal stress protein family protein n=1 Tax=Desulfonema limicola TaxID=45656 RepID=A0A975BEB3_9BACT|nr:universal stress protein [Desulfonema limicola]QTA83738.1 Universal stress protein family protein [Desulfonema limicola]